MPGANASDAPAVRSVYKHRLRADPKSAKFHSMSSFLIAPVRLAALLSGGLLLLLRLARR
jgi:hypothetical protein